MDDQIAAIETYLNETVEGPNPQSLKTLIDSILVTLTSKNNANNDSPATFPSNETILIDHLIGRVTTLTTPRICHVICALIACCHKNVAAALIDTFKANMSANLGAVQHSAVLSNHELLFFYSSVAMCVPSVPLKFYISQAIVQFSLAALNDQHAAPLSQEQRNGGGGSDGGGRLHSKHFQLFHQCVLENLVMIWPVCLEMSYLSVHQQRCIPGYSGLSRPIRALHDRVRELFVKNRLGVWSANVSGGGGDGGGDDANGNGDANGSEFEPDLYLRQMASQLLQSHGNHTAYWEYQLECVRCNKQQYWTYDNLAEEFLISVGYFDQAEIDECDKEFEQFINSQQNGTART